MHVVPRQEHPRESDGESTRGKRGHPHEDHRFLCGDKVFARDVDTRLWYRATVLAVCDKGCVSIEWDEPFEGTPEEALRSEDVRVDTSGLIATDEPPTEWQEPAAAYGSGADDVTTPNHPPT